MSRSLWIIWVVECFYSLRDDGTLGASDSFIPGDVNGDELINVIDIVALVSFILETDTPSDSEYLAGDFNGDGNLNVLDIVDIIALILS